MPYLTMHACYLMAARETGESARLSPSCDGPFRYLCENNWFSRRAVKFLMREPFWDAPPLLKLRGAETSIVARFSCKHGSFMNRMGLPVTLGGTQRASWHVPAFAIVVLVSAVLGS